LKYTNFEFGSYNIHFIQTSKFKTINVMFNFRRPIKKEEITKREVLVRTLLRSSKKYPSAKLIAAKGEELYNTIVNVENERIGNYVHTSFSSSFLNDKYLDEKISSKCLDFILEIIFNPNIKNNSFDSVSVSIAKNQTLATINSVRDDKMKYGLIKLLEKMGDNESYSYFSCGYEEDLKKITEENLYEYYKNMIQSDLLDIYILGDFDIDEYKKLIISKVPVNTKKRTKEPLEIVHKKIRTRLQKVKEYEKMNQAKLSIGCKLTNLTDFEKKYVLKLYSIILGGTGNSLLFTEVREKQSLAYYCSTKLKTPDNLLFIVAGINQENFNKTVSLIKKQLDNMKKGNFDEEILEDSKKLLLNGIETVEDDPSRILGDYVSKDLLNLDDITLRKKKILSVTRENVVELAKKIKIDTVHLLYGDDRNE